ncbi:MAG: EamA family transporter [Oscillospiraceae bacterium]
MWLVLAICSAFFAGVTSILAKCGIRQTDSDIATALRTIVVLVFSWGMAFISGSIVTIGEISAKSWLFLVLSGIATGASWLCYFKALQLGSVNKVVPIDKSGTALTIILSLIIFQENITWLKALCAAAILAGALLMIQKKEEKNESQSRAWLLFAILSAVFASLTSILAKIGISSVESNLGTAVRTVVVLIMAWIVVGVKGNLREVRNTPKRELGFIALSGIATGASWLCYFKALQDGPASVVVPIDKLSILVTIAFSYIVFKEKLTRRALIGLALIVAGTLCMLI